MIDLAKKCSSTYNGIVASFIFLGGCYWCTNLIEVHLVSEYHKNASARGKVAQSPPFTDKSPYFITFYSLYSLLEFKK